jgi:hypothetical protein
MSAKRAFEITRHDRREFAVITCGSCKHSEERIRPRLAHGQIANEGRYLKRGFEDKGWVVGKSHTDDRCPHCATAADKLRSKFKVVEKRQATLAEAVFAPKPAAAAPPPIAEAVQKSKPSRAAILALVSEARSKLDEIEKLLA